MGVQVGIDVGGTFTDLTCANEAGEVVTVLKVPSTPGDPSQGVLDALVQCGYPTDAITGFLHGTTIATNAVIERTGARCALVTTQGFRDVLELGRRDRIELYGLTGVQRPLVPREDRWEVDERVDYRGEIVTPLDEPEVRRLAEALAETDIGVIVIAFLHSYANPEHERRAAEIFREVRPEWEIVVSHDVISEYYEFERTSSAVVQGYLQPLVRRYADGLAGKLEGLGYDRQALVMQSNGGVVGLDVLGVRAARIVRSGPAAGVTAAVRIAAEAGFRDAITGDMGGTSFDVAVSIDGEPTISDTTALDFRIPLRVPMIDVNTIGAGGGSIASLDRGGTLTVGPRSAGAVPGPVCFRRGGTQPTVTDAHAVLGRINPASPIGADDGSTLDIDGARQAFTELGESLGMDAYAAAEAVLAVVNVRMAGRMRLLTVEQGYDPRQFALVAFGGAGPLHAAALLRDVGVRAVLIPPYPGVLCAQGCLTADIRYDYSRTLERRVDQLEPNELKTVFDELTDEGKAEIEGKHDAESVEVRCTADMAYLGQVHRLQVDVEPSSTTQQLADAFVKEYERQYGESLGDLPILLINIRVSVRGLRRQAVQPPEAATTEHEPQSQNTRAVYFDGEWRDTPVFERSELQPGARLSGPAVIEQADTTTILDPDMVATVDPRANLILEMEG